MLYPQNGDRIVAVDSVTSFHLCIVAIVDTDPPTLCVAIYSTMREVARRAGPSATTDTCSVF